MHERPKWVRARGLPLCDPLFNPNMHEQTYPLPHSNRWKRVSNSAWWAPILFSITLCTGDSWEADIPSSQLSLKNKRVWDPSYTHVHVCMWPPPQPLPQKTVNSTTGWSYFSKSERIRWEYQRHPPQKIGLIFQNMDNPTIKYQETRLKLQLVQFINTQTCRIRFSSCYMQFQGVTNHNREKKKDFDILSHRSTAYFTCRLSHSINASSPYRSSTKLWKSNWERDCMAPMHNLSTYGLLSGPICHLLSVCHHFPTSR